MSLAKTFYLLKDAEMRIGELYSLIALSVSVTQPDLADLLNDIAREEEQHARQVEIMRTYFQERPDHFLETPEAERHISEFMENLDTIRIYFNQNFATMKPADVIDLALDIERNLVECHQTFIFKVTDQKTESFFKSLIFGSNDHIRRLEEFKAGKRAFLGS